MIEFNEGTTKNYIMNHLKRLNSNEQFKGIVINHDMTPQERSECKQLVAEARDREDSDESGEYHYRVRGLPGNLKIVRLKKRLH